MALRAEERKGEIIGGICEQLASRLPDDDHALADRFARHFYRDVAPSDLLERDPLDLYGAALALFRFGQERRPGRAQAPRLQPAPGAAWLAVGAYDRRDRQRRHAVPGRQRQHGAEPARARHPPHHPSHCSRSAATRRAAWSSSVRARPATACARASCMSRSTGRAIPPCWPSSRRPVPRPGRRAPRGRGLAGDARPGRRGTGRACEPAPHSPAEELAEAVAFLRWLADDHLHLPRLQHLRAGDGRGRRDPAPPHQGHGRWASCAAHDDGALSPSFAALPAEVRARARRAAAPGHAHQGQLAQHRPPRDLSRLRRRQALRRRWPGRGRAPLPGPLHLRRLQPEPAPIPLLRPQGRARSIERSGFPPSGHAGKALAAHPGDLSAGRAAADPRPTSCWRRVPRSCTCRTGRGCACSSARDAFARFVSCLVFVPRDRYNTALRERMQRLLEEALGGTRERVPGPARRIDPRPPAVHHPHAAAACRPDFDAEALERRLVEASQGWADRLRDALIEPRARRTATACSAASAAPSHLLPGAGRRRVAAVPDILQLDRLAAAPTGGLAPQPLPPARGPGRRSCASSSSAATSRCCSPTRCRSSRTWASRS